MTAPKSSRHTPAASSTPRGRVDLRHTFCEIVKARSCWHYPPITQDAAPVALHFTALIAVAALLVAGFHVPMFGFPFVCPSLANDGHFALRAPFDNIAPTTLTTTSHERRVGHHPQHDHPLDR